MKIIFLDIDGVLNSWKNINLENFDIIFDSTLVQRLRTIIDATNAKIVLSTSHRVDNNDRGWRKLITDNVISMDELHHYNFKIPNSGSHRGAQIAEWLNNYGDDVETYVILDDNDDMLPIQREFFVKTKPQNGLEDIHVEKAIAILNKNT